MYVQFIDKQGFESAVLYIHSDHEWFLNFFNNWWEKLLEWLEEHPEADSLPLGRLDPETAMVDFLRALTAEVVKEDTEIGSRYAGRIVNWLRLLPNARKGTFIKKILLSKDGIKENIQLQLGDLEE